jgi:hypothetical protein
MRGRDLANTAPKVTKTADGKGILPDSNLLADLGVSPRHAFTRHLSRHSRWRVRSNSGALDRIEAIFWNDCTKNPTKKRGSTSRGIRRYSEGRFLKRLDLFAATGTGIFANFLNL